MTTPAVAGLPAETVTTLFNAIGLPNGLIGKQIYAQEIVYNQFDQLIGQNLGEHGRRVALTYGYDEPTGRPTTFNAVPELKTDVYNLRYQHSDAGAIESITDTPDGGQAAETQCFQYDALIRLTEAWSQMTSTCATTPTPSAVAGPAAYWRSYTYDPAGNRKTETVHQTTDTTRTYNYPASGGAAGSKPHAVTSINASGASTTVHQYAYDASGNTVCRPTGTAANVCATDGSAGTGSQKLTWNHQGQLGASTDTTGTTSYTYDTSGNRLIRRDPAGATLYLPGGIEIRKPKTGDATGTRYYSHAGSTIAVRNPTALTWLINDHQGTATATVTSDATLTATRRRTTPFGEDRGTKPASWPGEKGFVGGTRDNTGLTHLGAREYDPTIGRFISVDPIMDLADPQQWSAYSYSNNSPITWSDPTGLNLACGRGHDTPCPSKPADKGKTDTPAEPGGGGSGGNRSGGNTGGSTTDTLAAVPARAEAEAGCSPQWACEGWELLWDNIEGNSEALWEMAGGAAEAAAGVLLAGASSGLTAAGGVVVVGSGGALTIVGAPAAVLGATGIATGGAFAIHGASRFGNGASKLKWNNQAASPGKGSTARGQLEGKRDYVVNDPKDKSRTITDIDHIENGILWEEKSPTWAVDNKKWVDKQVTKKLNSYVEARTHLPGYENAPIGIRFTSPGVDGGLRAAVEDAVGNFRASNPTVDVRLEFQ